MELEIRTTKHCEREKLFENFWLVKQKRSIKILIFDVRFSTVAKKRVEFKAASIILFK